MGWSGGQTGKRDNYRRDGNLPAAFLIANASDMRTPVYGSIGSSAGDGIAMATGRGIGDVATREMRRVAIEREMSAG